MTERFIPGFSLSNTPICCIGRAEEDCSQRLFRRLGDGDVERRWGQSDRQNSSGMGTNDGGGGGSRSVAATLAPFHFLIRHAEIS